MDTTHKDKLWNQKVDYDEARLFYKTGQTMEEIARLYGVTPNNLRRGFERRGWLGEKKADDKQRMKIASDINDQIINLVNVHFPLTHQQIADRLKVSRQVITNRVMDLLKENKLTKIGKMINPGMLKKTIKFDSPPTPPDPTPICDECPDYQIVTIELLIKSTDDPQYTLDEIKDILQKHEDARIIDTRSANDEFVMIARFKNGK